MKFLMIFLYSLYKYFRNNLPWVTDENLVAFILITHYVMILHCVCVVLEKITGKKISLVKFDLLHIFLGFTYLVFIAVADYRLGEILDIYTMELVVYTYLASVAIITLFALERQRPKFRK